MLARRRGVAPRSLRPFRRAPRLGEEPDRRYRSGVRQRARVPDSRASIVPRWSRSIPGVDDIEIGSGEARYASPAAFRGVAASRGGRRGELDEPRVEVAELGFARAFDAPAGRSGLGGPDATHKAVPGARSEAAAPAATTSIIATPATGIHRRCADRDLARRRRGELGEDVTADAGERIDPQTERAVDPAVELGIDRAVSGLRQRILAPRNAHQPKLTSAVPASRRRSVWIARNWSARMDPSRFPMRAAVSWVLRPAKKR